MRRHEWFLTTVRKGSSAGTVLVIHNDGRLRIGTVPLAVP